jgi:hypothetical protein
MPQPSVNFKTCPGERRKIRPHIHFNHRNLFNTRTTNFLTASSPTGQAVDGDFRLANVDYRRGCRICNSSATEPRKRFNFIPFAELAPNQILGRKVNGVARRGKAIS